MRYRIRIRVLLESVFVARATEVHCGLRFAAEVISRKTIGGGNDTVAAKKTFDFDREARAAPL